ncbi:hypothetical protein SORBI_3001G331401 [Sorghum bicolor]|nr:hypothetical protein SORBI_3001G331401 [Sorghum bicolor]
MARKRKCSFMDDFPSDASNGLGDDELLLSGNSSAAEENNESSNDRLFDSEDSMSDAHHFVNEALCKQYMKECSRLEMLKKKLISSLSHNVKKKPDPRPKVGFSSQRFFGIFEDLEKIRSYDWCGFILSWLLEYIKLFNQLKGCKSTHQATLGGCLYFLAVLYLDHVDFGSHQVPSTIPRISVWKKDMITRYASLDLKEEGCYGYHPIMDYSRTCYAKDLRLLPQIRDQHIDPEFVSQLDRYARCKLPAELKDGICNLIEKHCLNCGVSVNFDVNSINALSDDMRLTFIKLWKHVYSVTKMSQHLVLEVIKLLSEGIENDENLCYDDGGLQSSPVIPEADPTPSGRHDKAKFDPDIQEVHPSQFKLHRSATHDEGLQSSPVIPKVGHMPSVRHRKAKFDTDIEEVHPSQFKLHQSTTDVSQYNRAKAIDDLGGSNSKVISNSKNPLVDVSNLKSVKKSSLKKSVSIGHDSSPVLEVVDLENKYVPDSISPASVPGFSRYFPQKSGSLLKKAGLASSSSGQIYATRYIGHFKWARQKSEGIFFGREEEKPMVAIA